jgi:antitoxin component of RelBE/YafQ-DinJ toxin-antitoxin module
MANQITCRLNEVVKERFSAYAARFDLDDSQLARLLFRREQHHRQLASLIASGEQVEVTSAVSSPRRPAITAHYRSRDAIAEFDAYAASCRLARNKAAAWILERELEERWLEKSFFQSPRGLRAGNP